MIDTVDLWFLGAYLVGTVLGFFWGAHWGATQAAETHMDALIEMGMLKQVQNPETGEWELVPWPKDE